jgi:hypothetical protein
MYSVALCRLVASALLIVVDLGAGTWGCFGARISADQGVRSERQLQAGAGDFVSSMRRVNAIASRGDGGCTLMWRETAPAGAVRYH